MEFSDFSEKRSSTVMTATRATSSFCVSRCDYAEEKKPSVYFSKSGPEAFNWKIKSTHISHICFLHLLPTSNSCHTDLTALHFAQAFTTSDKFNGCQRHNRTISRWQHQSSLQEKNSLKKAVEGQTVRRQPAAQTLFLTSWRQLRWDTVSPGRTGRELVISALLGWYMSQSAEGNALMTQCVCVCVCLMWQNTLSHFALSQTVKLKTKVRLFVTRMILNAVYISPAKLKKHFFYFFFKLYSTRQILVSYWNTV